MFRQLIFSSFLIGASAQASTLVKSAHRDPGHSYLEYMQRAAVLHLQQQEAPTPTAQEKAFTYGQKPVPAVTDWGSLATIQSRFTQLRDVRWMTTDDHPGFKRRATWLYPDDGCFARAALAVMNLVNWKDPAPNKIFVFGDLTVKTANAPGGEVSWWYHVAPIVQAGNQSYVLDPAIEPQHPLPLEDWLRRMNGDTKALQISICGSGSYTPDDRCEKATDGVEAQAAGDEVTYLGLEWDRVTELKEVPEQVLGDAPPWLHAFLGE